MFLTQREGVPFCSFRRRPFVYLPGPLNVDSLLFFVEPWDRRMKREKKKEEKVKERYRLRMTMNHHETSPESKK